MFHFTVWENAPRAVHEPPGPEATVASRGTTAALSSATPCKYYKSVADDAPLYLNDVLPAGLQGLSIPRSFIYVAHWFSSEMMSQH